MQWRIQEGGGGGAGGPAPTSVPPFGVFCFFTKVKFMSKNLVLNLYENGLKMPEMAILETQISPRKLATSELFNSLRDMTNESFYRK